MTRKAFFTSFVSALIPAPLCSGNPREDGRFSESSFATRRRTYAAKTRSIVTALVKPMRLMVDGKEIRGGAWRVETLMDETKLIWTVNGFGEVGANKTVLIKADSLLARA